MRMFEFLMTMWKENRVKEQQILDYRDKEFITPNEATKVLETPR